MPRYAWQDQWTYNCFFEPSFRFPFNCRRPLDTENNNDINNGKTMTTTTTTTLPLTRRQDKREGRRESTNPICITNNRERQVLQCWDGSSLSFPNKNVTAMSHIGDPVKGTGQWTPRGIALYDEIGEHICRVSGYTISFSICSLLQMARMKRIEM